MGIRILLLFGVFLGACAQVQPLDGGAKDESAPVPIFERASPKFASTEVKPIEIRIPFNEYIKLSNPNTNITITPELTTKPSFEVRGRELVIGLDNRALLDNTTYSIIFNKAIADLNEGNDTTLTYVFSTGKSIDSLTYSALVVDAENQTPVANALVGLYSPSDTLNPYKHRPKYVAQTNKEGKAEFQFLAEQNLAVFAYYNKEGGKIAANSMVAFLNNEVKIDTAQRVDTLYLFTTQVQENRGRILRKEIALNGRIELVTDFQHNPAEFTISKDDQAVDFIIERTSRKDSTLLWIKAQENSTYNLHVPFKDSILSTRIQTRKLESVKTKYADNLISGELEISDSLNLVFDLPLLSFDTSKIQVYADSISVPFKIIKNGLRGLQLIPGNKQNRLVIAPNAIRFYNGTSYDDTIVVEFIRKTEKKYANLELILENKPQHPLILRLYKDKEVYIQRIVATKDSIINFSMMQPGEYSLQVLVDLNENTFYDSGNYPEKRQPEPVIWFRQPIILRANWDTKQAVQFK